MSLLMKLSGKIEHLSLFDIVNTPGVAADISHCNSMGSVSLDINEGQAASNTVLAWLHEKIKICPVVRDPTSYHSLSLQYHSLTNPTAMDTP